MNTRIGIIDYQCGNLRNIQRGIEANGDTAIISGDTTELSRCDKLVLPGVGAFQECWRQLSRQFGDALRPLLADKPVLGICIGMQILFESSLEHGRHPGLGLLMGRVEKIQTQGAPVPHVGWNQLSILKGRDTLFRGIPDGSHYYFTHSYHCVPDDDHLVAATSHYEGSIVTAIIHDNLYATQFHPEKSQYLGLKVLENFVRYC